MSTGTPIWVSLIAGLGTGAVGTGMGFWQARKLLPTTKRQMEAEASHSEADSMKLAVQTVEEALGVARGSITNLQTQVTTLSGQIGELRERLTHSESERVHIEEALNIALSERAKLEQQIMDLNRRVGSRRLEDLGVLRPPDAIVMIDLESGQIVYANEGVYPLLGYTPSRLVGEPLEFLVPEGLRGRHTKERVDYARHPTQRAMGKGLPLFIRPNGGGSMPVDISLHPTGDGRVIALIKRRTEDDVDKRNEEEGLKNAALAEKAESSERSLVH